MSDKTLTVEAVATLASELSHHINTPLAVALASIGQLERMTLEMSATHANEQERRELEDILGDVNEALGRIRSVVSNLNTLAFQITRREHLLGDPFPRKP